MTDRQTGQKQYTPDHSIRRHKSGNDSDYEVFSVEPYMYEPEFSDCQSDFSESDSDSEESCILKMTIVLEIQIGK
ncbi:hypothetical protein DPMN_017758 [Dreissena polymorpha]|uniref:Uncharacterized protein n=1 Tax=Dreissena polymorpha TaxID=45954 RepID=A0A9D4S7M9_DREPO|nr:hypothetical protein DPMN_017758 [Dreissena polymorpha]